MESADAYPLAWPIGWPRTKSPSRAAFRATDVRGHRLLTIGEGRDRLVRQLGLLCAVSPVISTNAPTRNDGMVRADANNPKDPGAAVYFRLPDTRGNMQPHVLACDRWDRLADNLAALAAHIEALRGIDRWGVGSMEQAFAGYKALYPVGARKPWWEVLAFAQQPHPEQAEMVKQRFRDLMKRHHPDRGGNGGQAAEITEAYRQACEEMQL
jgi:hypothetical protein